MRTLQLITGQKIPALGFGTWEMGGRLEADYSKDAIHVNALTNAIQTGFTHLDTAEMYGAGHAEELVGHAIRDIARESLFLTSKVKKENLAYRDVILSCEKTLERMQTHFLDLYLIHHPSLSIPIRETMKALDELISKGLIRHIGVSNFSVEQLKEAQEAAKNPVVINQIEYNLQTRNRGLFNQEMETSIIPYCRKNGVVVTAWRPLVKGALQKNHPILKALSEKYGCTESQLAISWLLNKPGISTIVKATSMSHIRENYLAASIILDPEDISLLDGLQTA